MPAASYPFTSERNVTETPPYVSVVAPAYNEELGIESFVTTVDAKLAQLLSPQARGFEIVLVDDGSRDGTVEKICELIDRGLPVRLVQLSRNFGHQMAITAGIDAAQGDVIITMDADLQHPPSYFGPMLAAMAGGADVVLMRKRSSHQRESYKTALARGFYALMARISDVRTEPDVGDFRLLTREVADVLRGCRETHRFLRGLVAWVGFRQVTLDYEVAPRFAGSSKYNLRRLWRLASSGLFSHSSVPLKWPIYLGMPLFGGAALYILWGLLQHVLQPEAAPRGWLSGFAFMTLFSGLLFTAIGLQGAYMAKLFEQSKGRPLYIARRARGPRLARHDSPDEGLAADRPAFFVAASGRPVVVAGALPAEGPAGES
jgi:glycosyltransferase involved in cell wall biosynthesis